MQGIRLTVAAEMSPYHKNNAGNTLATSTEVLYKVSPQKKKKH
jgi:hypothetical protein